MAVLEVAEPSTAAQQLAAWNQNLGGNIIKRISFDVPADIHYCVVGCVLADAATPASVESTLIPAVTALAEVTSVNGDQVFGQVPATIEEPAHEAVLHVVGEMAMFIGQGADVFSQNVTAHEQIKPPVNKKWVVMILRVPAALDQTSITTLEAAIEGIAGVTVCEHLIDGSTSTRQVGTATLRIAAHLRIDPVEV